MNSLSEPSRYIHLDNVSKRYADIDAVSAVSFEVAKGEFVAILGPSGCGKSTLLMMCAGLEHVTSGSITIDGAVMSVPRSNIGVMFQDPTLLGWKSVMDNIMLPIRIQHRPDGEYLARAQNLVDQTGLQGFGDKRPRELSGGMRQRVAICRALVHDPDILLMDEPFSALDAITRDEMNELLLEIWQRYTRTALFVTHSIREAVLLADRVLVMAKRPATVIADIKIPFARPRSTGIAETSEFQKLCELLKGMIEHGRT